MSSPISDKLERVNELINKGKFEEALQHVNDLEQKENLNTEEMLITLSYKGRLYRLLGYLEDALKISENLYQKSQEMNMSFYSVDALSLRLRFLHILPLIEFEKTFEQYKTLFNSLPREISIEYQKREASFKLNQGWINFFIGNSDLALDDLNESLTLFKQIDPRSLFIISVLALMA